MTVLAGEDVGSERIREMARLIYMACRTTPAIHREGVIDRVESELRSLAAEQIRDAANDCAHDDEERNRIIGCADDLEGG